MIDVVGMVEWLFATLLGLVTEGGIVGIPILVVAYLILTGRLVPAPPRKSPCSRCRIRGLTLGAPDLIRCNHEEN